MTEPPWYNFEPISLVAVRDHKRLDATDRVKVLHIARHVLVVFWFGGTTKSAVDEKMTFDAFPFDECLHVSAPRPS